MQSDILIYYRNVLIKNVFSNYRFPLVLLLHLVLQLHGREVIRYPRA